MEQPIDLNPPTAPAQGGGISLGPDPAPKASPGLLAARADKANLGLSSVLNKPKEDIAASISSNEDGFRQEAAATIDYQKAQQKQSLVSQIMRTGGEVDPQKLSEFMSPSPPTDPRSVIEENYGRKFVSPILNMADDFMKNTSMKEAMERIPQQVNDAFNAGSDLAAKTEYARKRRDDMQEIYKNQSWAPFLAQTAEGLVPTFTSTDLANMSSDPDLANWSGLIVRGSNLEQQRQNVYNLPWDQFKTKLDADFEKSKTNPSIGMQYFQGMVGQSSQELDDNNIQSLMDLSVIGGPAYKAAKGIVGMSRMLELHGEVIQGVKDVVKATEAVKDGPVYEMSPEEYSWENEGGAVRKDVEVVQADAKGDLKEAGIKQAAQNTLREINQTSNPTSMTIQALPTVYKKDQRNLAVNPGNYGQEIVNRQAEVVAAHIDQFTNVIENTAKINRVPELLASEDAQRALFEKTKNDHPELNGNIINITGPHWNEAANTWENHIILGKNTGERWHRVDQAKNWAKINRIPLQTTERTYKEATIRKIGPNKYVPGPTRVLKKPDTKLIPGARIRQHGFGFHIEKAVPIDLTNDIVRNTFGTTEFSKQPHSVAENLVDTVVGWLRTPDETMSMDDRIIRKQATAAPGNYMEVARAAIQDIAKIAPASQTDLTRPAANKRWEEWSRTVKATQDKRDPSTGELGYDYRNPGEFENDFQIMHDRPPSQQEIAAYFAFKRINADDLNYRSLSLLRNKHNVGAQSHQFEVTKDGKQVKSPWIDGVRRSELPGGRDTIAIFKRDMDHTKLMPANMVGKARDEIEEEVKSGRSMVFEIYDPDSTPLKGFGSITDENQIRYVVARGFSSRPLNVLDQLPRRGGGHIEYDHNAYLKKADMVQDPTTKRWRYRGDITAHALPNQALGEGFAKQLNEVDKLIDANRITEAKTMYEGLFSTEAGNINASWDEHYSNYLPTKDSSGKTIKKARFSAKEPYVVVPKDKTIADMPLLWKGLEDRYRGEGEESMFEDGSRHGSLARQNTIQYTGQRDAYELYQVQDVGSRHNPVYKYAPAKTIDSIPMQMRALQRIINDFSGMNDQKMYAIEHWLFGDADGLGNGAEHYIATDNKNDIRYSPFYYYNNYKYRNGVVTGSPVWSRLEQIHYKSKAFAGTPSIIDNYLTATAQKLADTIYTKGGPAASKIDPSWMLPALSDGPRFMRSVFFNIKMGLWHPAMFAVHAFTYGNVAAITGVRPAAAGAFGALMHGYSAINKSEPILNYMDHIASQAGFAGWNWKPGWFKESYQGMMKFGANRLEPAQLSALDNPTSPRILENAGSHLLDVGLTPFKMGIKPVKLASWHTAYLEWRYGGGGKMNWEPHPTGAPTHAEWGQILERSDLLSHNMTRASTSVPQKILAGLPTQFGGYTLRVMEMLTGKRLSPTEKARFVGTFMTMYGVPSAAGIVGLSALVRNWASTPTDSREGYVPGSDLVSTAVMEGLLSAGVGLLTGKGDIRKGNVYNFGSRYGLGDLNFMDSLLDGDPNTWNIWGAAPAGIANTIAASTPLRNWGMSLLKGDGKFQLTPEHVIGVLKEISVVNDLDKAYWGAVAHRWVSRNGRTIASDISTMNTLSMVLSGLQEQRFADAYPAGQAIKHMKDQENKAFGLAVGEYTRGLQAIRDQNDDQATKYFMNGRFYMEGYPEEKWNEVIAAAFRENKDLLETLDMERYMGKALPIEQRQKAQDTLSNILRMQQEKKQP